jgi:hypothetical protein
MKPLKKKDLQPVEPVEILDEAKEVKPKKRKIAPGYFDTNSQRNWLCGFIIIAMAVVSCHKVETTTTPQKALEEKIHGNWQGLPPFNEQHYHFCGGQLDHRIIGLGATLYQNSYTYTTIGDTMRLTDTETNQKKVWVFGFPRDSTAVFDQVGGVFVVTLKRN